MSGIFGEDREFIEKAKAAADSSFSAWAERAVCWYDDYDGASRDYALTVKHTWGRAYCSFNESNVKALKEKLLAIGACHIKVKCEWNRCLATFDMRKDYYTSFNKAA